MLDRFNRVTSSRWASYKGSGERDFYRVDIAYDHDSNILSAADRIHKNASGDRNFDVLYSHDDLGRLTRAEEGELDSGSITGRSRDERWLDSSGNLALSQTGNWLHRRLDLDGDGQFTGTDELDETNAFNLANELIERDINSSSTPDYEPSYNLAGHQIDDGKDYEYVYDAFGRLMEVRDRVSKDLVAAYRYNGLNFRIGWHSDVTDDSGGDPDGVVDEEDPWFWFCYDDRWRVVAVFRDEDEDPKEVFVHHNAGLAGYGGSSYIDSVILRDRDTSGDWHEEADDTRAERVYYAQNWRGDVSALLTDTGSMIEWVKYSAYGVPYSLPAGDVDSNGTWDVSDEDLINERIAGGPYDVRFDTNLDGVIDNDDITHANSIAGGYQTLGRGTLSSPAVANRVGYAGYQYDPTFKGASRTIYHVRHRVYDADVGRWTRRDPLGYVDGMSLYQYVRSMPVRLVDPRGTDAAVGGGGPPRLPVPGFDPCTAERTYAECLQCCENAVDLDHYNQCRSDCFWSRQYVDRHLVPPWKGPPANVSPEPGAPPLPPTTIGPSFWSCVTDTERDCTIAPDRETCLNCCEDLDLQRALCMYALEESLTQQCAGNFRCERTVLEGLDRNIKRLEMEKLNCTTGCILARGWPRDRAE